MTQICMRARLVACALLALAAAAPATRADFLTIDFDATPSLALASPDFDHARQDLTIPGLAAISGGTPIGNPDNLASFGPGGGSGNAYGTRSGTSFGYLENLTIDFAPSAMVTRVQGTLFNGYPDLNSYTVTIFAGAIQVGSATFADLADNSLTTGFANFDLSAAAITRLVVTPDTTFSGGGWDYFLDNVGVTYARAVPEPASLAGLSVGLATMVLVRRLRRRVGNRSPSTDALRGRAE